MSDIRWDTELIRRYRNDEQPFAGCLQPTDWRDSIGSFELLHALRDCRQRLRPLSLRLHLPFCASACWHCERVQIQTCDPEQIQSYLEWLAREIERLGCHLDPRQSVEQLHFSGGSPTMLGNARLRQLMDCLGRHFTLSSSISRDFVVEVDPREADWSSMGLLRELGFNRLNLRVDELDPDVQAAINYWPSLANTRTLVEAAHTLQFRSVSIELMRGLPGQSAAHFSATLKQIIALQPDRLSLPRYHHQPHRFAAQRQIAVAQLPDPQERLEILRCSVELLQQAGYRYIGLDLFALPDDDLAAAQEESLLRMNVLGLTLQDSEVLGIGASAISHIGNFYSQNHKDLARYRNALENDQLPTRRGLLNDAEQALQQALSERLICSRHLHLPTFEQHFAIDFRRRFADIWPHLQEMAAAGLLTLDANQLSVTEQGVLLTDSLCRLFRDSQPASANTSSRQASQGR